jgi:hypothetical protein
MMAINGHQLAAGKRLKSHDDVRGVDSYALF